MNLKKRVLGAASTAVLAGSLIVAAAPSAHAVVIGGCSGLTSIGTLTPALDGAGANTTTVAATKDLKAGLVVHSAVSPALDVTAGAGQTCTGGVGVAKTSAKMSGIASCLSAANTPPAQQALQYPLNGKLGIKGASSISAYVRVAGFDPAGPDAIDLTGIVVKGTFVGATVGGSLTFDPIAKDPTPKSKNYVFDSAQLTAPCGSVGGTPIGLVLISDGTSLLGTTATGLNFSF